MGDRAAGITGTSYGKWMSRQLFVGDRANLCHVIYQGVNVLFFPFREVTP